MRAMVIDFRSREPLYSQLAAILRQRITDGTYPADSQLPSVLSLAAEHRVSDAVVRQALTILKDEELVIGLPGRGTFVTGR